MVIAMVVISAVTAFGVLLIGLALVADALIYKWEIDMAKNVDKDVDENAEMDDNVEGD